MIRILELGLSKRLYASRSFFQHLHHMVVSWNGGTPSHHPISMGFSIERNHPFLISPISGNPLIYIDWTTLPNQVLSRDVQWRSSSKLVQRTHPFPPWPKQRSTTAQLPAARRRAIGVRRSGTWRWWMPCSWVVLQLGLMVAAKLCSSLGTMGPISLQELRLHDAESLALAKRDWCISGVSRNFGSCLIGSGFGWSQWSTEWRPLWSS